MYHVTRAQQEGEESDWKKAKLTERSPPGRNRDASPTKLSVNEKRRDPPASRERADSAREEFQRQRRFGQQAKLITEPNSREIRQRDGKQVQHDWHGRPQLPIVDTPVQNEADIAAAKIINRIVQTQ